DVVKPLHQVYIRLATPVAVDSVNELLPVAGRSARVDHDHHITIGGKQLSVPAIAPLIAPLPLRTAMNQELYRILSSRVEVRWLDDEALHLGGSVAGEPERLHHRHVDLGKYRIV